MPVIEDMGVAVPKGAEMFELPAATDEFADDDNVVDSPLPPRRPTSGSIMMTPR